MKAVECKEVIITTLERRGGGLTEEDTVRRVLQVWDKQGNLIAEKDPVDESFEFEMKFPRKKAYSAASEGLSDVSMESFLNIQHFAKSLAEKIKNDWRPDVEFPKDTESEEEPEILAVFPDGFDRCTYPSRDWFVEVNNLLKNKLAFKRMDSPHFKIIKAAVRWIEKYKLYPKNSPKE